MNDISYQVTTSLYRIIILYITAKKLYLKYFIEYLRVKVFMYLYFNSNI